MVDIHSPYREANTVHLTPLKHAMSIFGSMMDLSAARLGSAVKWQPDSVTSASHAAETTTGCAVSLEKCDVYHLLAKL